MPGGLVIADEVKVGDFATCRDLQIEVGRERPAESGNALIANLLDLPGSPRKRHLPIIAAVPAQLDQASFLVERIERALERQLAIVLSGLPMIFAAKDGF